MKKTFAALFALILFGLAGFILLSNSGSLVEEAHAADPAPEVEAAPDTGDPGYDFSIPPTAEQKAALEEIRGKIPGFIVFESNRSGEWQLYRMNADGTGFKQLTDMKRYGDDDPMYATISPDGKTIAWEHREKDDRAQVWLMDADGSNHRRLFDEEISEQSTRPSYLPDGRLKFGRNGSGRNQHIFVYDWNKSKPKQGLLQRIFGDDPELPDDYYTWQEEMIMDFDETRVKTKRVETRDITPDCQYIVAFSKYPGQGTWWFSTDGQVQERVQGGCSPRIMPDGQNFLWVMIAGTFGIGTFEDPLQTEVLFNGPYPDQVFNHGYFPYLTGDYKYLTLSACPHDQHDHDTANYQVMVVEMDENLKPVGKATRLTFSNATDRYPVMWVPGMYDESIEPPTIQGQAHKEVKGPGDFH
jgi:hypothetical protein